MRRFVTVDEIWIHHNTPETKQQSEQWVSPGESAPKKTKEGLSANKVMATEGKNNEWRILDRFNEDLKKKGPHLAKKKVLFHQDYARVHTCVVSMAKFHEFCYE